MKVIVIEPRPTLLNKLNIFSGQVELSWVTDSVGKNHFHQIVVHDYIPPSQNEENGTRKVEVLTMEMKEKAGMTHRYVRDFSGGTSGLRKVKVK